MRSLSGLKLLVTNCEDKSEGNVRDGLKCRFTRSVRLLIHVADLSLIISKKVEGFTF